MLEVYMMALSNPLSTLFGYLSNDHKRLHTLSVVMIVVFVILDHWLLLIDSMTLGDDDDAVIGVVGT